MISPLVLDALGCTLARPSTSAFVPLLLRFRDGERQEVLLWAFDHALRDRAIPQSGAPYYAARAVERAFYAEHWSSRLGPEGTAELRAEAEMWAAGCREDFGGTGATT